MKQLTKMVMLLIVTALVAGGVAYSLAPKGPDARVTVQSIRKIAHLATVEYRLAALMDQAYYSDAVFTNVRSSRMIAYYTGAVKGSVDLEKTDIDVTDEAEGGRVSIHFNRGSIMISGVEIVPGEDSMKEILCEKKTGFNPPTENQREGLRQKALKIIRQKAIEQGIIDKTIENATTVLSEFVGALGLQAVIEFDENAYDPAAS